jgi:hypothetical protein
VRWIFLGICLWTRVRGDPEKGVGQWIPSGFAPPYRQLSDWQRMAEEPL